MSMINDLPSTTTSITPARPLVGARLRVSGPYQPLDPFVATEALRAIHGVGAPIGLGIMATAERVEVGVTCHANQVPELDRALRGAAPGWAIEVVALAGPSSAHCPRLTGIMGWPARPDWAPLRDVREFAGADPGAPILEAVQPLAEGEAVLILYLAWPTSSTRRARAERELTVPASAGGVAGVLGALLDIGPREPRFEPRRQRPLEERLSEAAFEVVGTVTLAGLDRGRLESRSRSLASAFATTFDCGFGGISLGSWRWQGSAEATTTARQGEPASIYMTAGELAALWHPLSNQVFVPGVSYLRRPSTPLPTGVARARGLLLGTHCQQGMKLPVYLPRPDLDAGHLSITGRTGVGKSTLVQQILAQLAASPDCPGLGLIDPNNDLALDMALRSIPKGREKDVVFLELGDTESPVRLSPFWAPPGVPTEALVQTTFSTLRLIFRENWSPTRMEDAVFALTATLCRLEGATPLDAPRLFGDPNFRRQAISILDDPVALQFWADYETLSDAGRRELIRPVLYRLRSFYRSPAIRNLVCQPTGIDFLDLMDQGRILLISLAGSAIQAEADLLGELIIARLHLAALARLDRQPEGRRRFYLAVDESQRFRGGSLPVLLREGRKLGITLILSTQYMDAWGEELAQSVLGTVGTLVAFRCGPKDSRLLTAGLKPFTADQLEDLDRYEAVAKLQIDGTTVPAFDFATLPIDAPPNETMLSNVRSRTRQSYARPRREVEELLANEVPHRPGIERGIDVNEE